MLAGISKDDIDMRNSREDDESVIQCKFSSKLEGVAIDRNNIVCE